ERIAVGLDGDGVQDPGRERRGAAEERLRELASLVRAERAELEPMNVVTGSRLRPLLQQELERRSRLQILAATAGDQEQRRRGRRREQLYQERRAVRVPPLNVVNDEHERRAAPEAAEELPERREDAAANLLRIRPCGEGERALGDGRRSLQHRK